MIKYFFFLFFSLISLFTLAQGEANVWYFGFGAGIDFNTSPPSGLTDGMLSTDEGCSSICDASGNLLFYSNGETIFNRNHQIMENGTGLAGHFSSTQSALIVPQPLSSNLYLIFTVGAEAGFNGSNNGLSYSIIDMELDNGNGAVIEKNIQLLNYTTEKQTAVRHSNGRDIWIVTHLFESNAFYSFLLTCQGVQPEPTISYVGKSHIEPNIGCCEGTSTLGCMKSSPDNKKIAVVWSELTELNTQAGLVKGDWHMELFDFDPSTGNLSNPISMTYGNNSNNHKSYGVCFSPDNTKLYQTAYQGVPSYKLFQYDLTAADIPASQTIIAEESIKAFGTMEIGPDGKIYIARTNGHKFLSVINNPNAFGDDTGYEKEGISLEGINSTWGLPNILYDYSFQPIFDFLPADSTICNDQSILLEMESLDADSYLWSDGSIFSNTSIQSSGWHWLEVNSENCGEGRDSIFVTVEDCNCKVKFPNAFSPNGDNENDFFQPVRADCDYPLYDLKIFSRWGEVVFSTNDQHQSWDGYFKGKKGLVGVYVYCLNYKYPGNNDMQQVVGDISLMW
ncbi:MAG: gliding motility-associated C-terminal domain-containing protein [Saprospiraceae bacterium]